MFHLTQQQEQKPFRRFRQVRQNFESGGVRWDNFWRVHIWAPSLNRGLEEFYRGEVHFSFPPLNGLRSGEWVNWRRLKETTSSPVLGVRDKKQRHLKTFSSFPRRAYTVGAKYQVSLANPTLSHFSSYLRANLVWVLQKHKGKGEVYSAVQTQMKHDTLKITLKTARGWNNIKRLWSVIYFIKTLPLLWKRQMALKATPHCDPMGSDELGSISNDQKGLKH